MHLIDDRSLEISYESDRVTLGSGKCRGIVEGEIGTPLSRKAMRQRGLAGLPGAGDRHDASVAERESNSRLRESWIHGHRLVSYWLIGNASDG